MQNAFDCASDCCIRMRTTPASGRCPRRADRDQAVVGRRSAGHEDERGGVRLARALPLAGRCETTMVARCNRLRNRMRHAYDPPWRRAGRRTHPSSRVTEGTQMTSQPLMPTLTDPTAREDLRRRKVPAGHTGSRRPVVADHGTCLLRLRWAPMPMNDPDCLDARRRQPERAESQLASRDEVGDARCRSRRCRLTVADLGRHRQIHAGSRMGYPPEGGRT